MGGFRLYPAARCCHKKLLCFLLKSSPKLALKSSCEPGSSALKRELGSLRRRGGRRVAADGAGVSFTMSDIVVPEYEPGSAPPLANGGSELDAKRPDVTIQLCVSAP